MRPLSFLFLSASAAALALSLGCASAPPKPPQASADDPGAEHAAAEPEPEAAAPGEVPQARKPAAARDDSAPESYELTPRDCDALGDQLATVTRADQLAELSPKLTGAQRAQADASITEVARKVGEKWGESCRGSLVGGVTDSKSLRCALRARTVKDFDECLNGVATEKPPTAKKKP